MKSNIIMLFLLILTIPSHSHAGDKVLNGGSVLLCESSDQSKFVKLLDYYEAELNGRNINLPSASTWHEKLKQLFTKWLPVAPLRIPQYEKWLDTFTEEAGIYSGIQIPPTNDTGAIAIPVGCKIEMAAFQRNEADIFPGVKRYVINKNLWDLMDETQKAGLVLHELIYRESITMGHATSLPTRYLNGILSSTTPNSNDYLQTIARMPLKYIEYQGAILKGADCVTSDGGNNSCVPAVLFHDNNQISEASIIGFYGDEIRLGQFRMKGNLQNGSYNFEKGVPINFDTSGRLLPTQTSYGAPQYFFQNWGSDEIEASFALRPENYYWKGPKNFQLKISYLRQSVDVDKVRFSDAFGFEFLLSPNAKNITLTYIDNNLYLVITNFTEGSIEYHENTKEILWNNVAHENSPNFFLTDPSKTFIIADGHKISNIMRIDFNAGIGNRVWSKITTTSGYWIKNAQGKWVPHLGQ